MDAGTPVDPAEFYTRVAAGLDGLALVPADVLFQVVTRDGACMVLHRLELDPAWVGDEMTDRETAARICAGCPVRRECLELELRTSGDTALGVWGALPAEDVRDLYPVWQSRRQRRGHQLGDEPSGKPGTGAGGGRE